MSLLRPQHISRAARSERRQITTMRPNVLDLPSTGSPLLCNAATMVLIKQPALAVTVSIHQTDMSGSRDAISLHSMAASRGSQIEAGTSAGGAADQRSLHATPDIEAVAPGGVDESATTRRTGMPGIASARQALSLTPSKHGNRSKTGVRFSSLTSAGSSSTT